MAINPAAHIMLTTLLPEKNRRTAGKSEAKKEKQHTSFNEKKNNN